MFLGDKAEFLSKFRCVFGNLCRDRHRKCANRDGLVRFVDQLIARIESSTAEAFRNLDKLQHPGNVPPDRVVDVIAFEMHNERGKIWPNELWFVLRAIIHHPRRALRQAISWPKKKFHHLLEFRRIAPDVFDDLHRMIFRVLGEECFADVHFS